MSFAHEHYIPTSSFLCRLVIFLLKLLHKSSFIFSKLNALLICKSNTIIPDTNHENCWGFEIFLVNFGQFLQNGHWIYQFICYKMPPKYYPVTINFIILLLPLNSPHTWQRTLGGWVCWVIKTTAEYIYSRDYIHNNVTNNTFFEVKEKSHVMSISHQQQSYVCNKFINIPSSRK